MATKPKTAAAQAAEIEAQIEKFRPRSGADEPARGGTLWHLNSHGLLYQAILLEQSKLGVSVDGITVTRQTAWEVMAEAQRNGDTF